MLHNGNKIPSIRLAHAVDLKESYESMSQILNSINFDAYKWQICGDVKVIGLLLGLQGRFTVAVFCLCDNGATESQYKVKDRPHKNQLPPLYIKLELTKSLTY